MTLDVYDLGLLSELRQIVSEVSSARLILVEEQQEQSNPFEVSESTFVVRFDVPAFSVKQLSASQARGLFGAVDASYYSLTIARPETGVEIQQGWWAYINYSRGLQEIRGLVERVDEKLSGLINLYVNTTPAVPLTNTQFLGL